MKTILSVMLVALMLSVTGGCTTHDYGPARYSPTLLDQLEPGETTVVEAKKLFGTPTADMPVDGGRLLQWQVRKTQGVPGATDSHLALLFDEDGKLVRIQRATRR
ncbi:MAG: hypothetical protein R3270_06735 [Gammaproteobacteria bacterium]|nr:hypothetical protein [Gammaproteobacteria bacterium]